MANPADEAEQVWRSALNWFPEEIRAQVENVLATDQRIAQEITDWELLQHQATLI